MWLTTSWCKFLSSRFFFASSNSTSVLVYRFYISYHTFPICSHKTPHQRLQSNLLPAETVSIFQFRPWSCGAQNLTHVPRLGEGETWKLGRNQRKKHNLSLKKHVMLYDMLNKHSWAMGPKCIFQIFGCLAIARSMPLLDVCQHQTHAYKWVQIENPISGVQIPWK